MTVSVKNPYLHLVVTLILSPFIVDAPTVFKTLFSIYAIYLVFTKDAFSIPALSVLASFLSSAYVIYLGFLLISLLNVNRLYKNRVHLLFFATIIPLPFIAFVIYQKLTLQQMGIGISLEQFQLYFSLFSFFYGIIIAPTITPQKIRAIVIMLFVLLGLQIFQIFENDIPVIRLVFASIPLATAYIAGRNKFASSRKYIINLILWVILIYLFLFTETTFTLLLSSFFSYSLSRLYFNERYRQIKLLTGIPVFLAIFMFMFYAITSYKEKDFRDFKAIKMSEINSFEMLINRAKMKIFEDRSPLWTGALKTLYNYSWGVPLKVPSIKLSSDDTQNKTIEVAYHSHNIFLELPRTLGLIVGTLTSVIFIIIVLMSRKYILMHDNDFSLIILTITAMVSLIIGSFSGIYPLLPTFAGTILVICGIASYKYRCLKTNCQ